MFSNNSKDFDFLPSSHHPALKTTIYIVPIFSSDGDIYIKVEGENEEIWIQVMKDDGVNTLAEQCSEEALLKALKDQNIKIQKGRTCHICGNVYKDLGRHLEAHGFYNCLDCFINFETKELLDAHLQKVHNIIPESHYCSTCDISFSSLIKFALHNYKHSRKYSCPLCDFVVKGTFRNSLVNHIKRHQGNFEVNCEVCGKGFVTKHTLASHMEIHEDIPKYECQICKKKFTVKRYLEVHKSLNHKMELYGIEEIFQCEVCGRKFTFERSLIRHLSAIHKVGADRTVDCPICEKKLANNHNLNKHMRTHTGEKRFCCDLCGKAFSEKKDLKKHQRVHERERLRNLGSIVNTNKNSDEDSSDLTNNVLYFAYDS